MFRASNFLKNKGISAFIALAVMTTLLLMLFGLVSIISPQIKMTGEIGKSVIAFHAADSGIERLAEAIYVGYDYYEFPAYGKCHKEEEKGEERKWCDYGPCRPEIESNSPNCGLPSMCISDDDCLCPKDKCIGWNYYDYPERGHCHKEGDEKYGKCIGCDPEIRYNNEEYCGYDQETLSCNNDSDCPCPPPFCQVLEPDASPPGWETPYNNINDPENLGGAIYRTYILGPNSIKSIGSYQGVSRAIEVTF